MTKPVRLVIFGRQGAGKGTQCLKLVDRYGAVHISTGDILRSAVEEGTDFGRKADSYMSRGELVPDDVMIGIVQERLAKPDVVAHGFLLDGFPRTQAQAMALVETLGSGGIDLAVDLDVPLEVVRERIAGRARADDSPESVDRRLRDYEDKTVPAVEWFGSIGKLVQVDGLGTEDEVFGRVAHVIDTHV